MHVRVLPFGVLKDWLGAAPATIELLEGASVADLLQQLDAPADALYGIAVSVNTEFATSAQVLCEGDEVGLLPPVSGGTAPLANVLNERVGEPIVVALTADPIDAEKLIASAERGEDGAVVVFAGIVRNNTGGRATLYLDYEAYEAMAVGRMKDLAAQARERFRVRQVTIVHRLGRLYIGETSVLIVVASAHRAPAFNACRWLIDSLKRTVPIWKRETFVDGTVWAAGEPFPAGVAVNRGAGQ